MLSCSRVGLFCSSVDCMQSLRLLCPWGFSGQEYWSELPCPPGNLPNPGVEPRSSTLQVDSLSTEPPGKPRNTEGSLSLLQGNFPTQESNGFPALQEDSLPPELPGKPLIRTVCGAIHAECITSERVLQEVRLGRFLQLFGIRSFFLEISTLSRGMPWE